MSSERRRYGRMVLPDDRLLHCEGVNRSFAGRVSVIGTGGMYIHTQDLLPHGTEFEIRVRAGGEVLELPCVVRDVTPGGVGVEFTWMQGPFEDKVRRFMALLES